MATATENRTFGRIKGITYQERMEKKKISWKNIN